MTVNSGTYLTNTLRAPSGVTSIAGANPYAAKLAASPAAMVISPTHHNHSLRYAYPPLPALEVDVRDTLSKPFFLTMKLVPIKMLELTAKASPM
jgi:hypothetical protein